MEWAREYLHDDFSDVVWTDETTVQLESHKRYCCRKQGATPKPKPHPKHPRKVHVWGGISTNGRMELVIFEGIMDASLYLEILKVGLKLVTTLIGTYIHRRLAIRWVLILHSLLHGSCMRY